MKFYIISILCLIFAFPANSQVTYADDIAEIVYQHCSTCHRSGEIGPMQLTNYEQVKTWGNTIKYVTENNIMPPWQPDPSYSTFLEENFLDEDQKAKIVEWVENGMPRGNESDEPAFPDFPDGSVLGTPDLVLEMAEEWLHEGNNEDDYRYFVLPTGLTEDRIVKAVEFRPGNSSIVHHALLFEDTTGEAAENDAETPEYGFPGFGSFLNGDPGGILNQKQFPGFVPGQKPIRYPDGVGQVLHAGADVVAQLHYAPWPVDQTDKSTINIFFMDEGEETLEREFDAHIMVPFFQTIGEPFVIPANQVKTFHGTFTVPIDVSLVNIAPHMHLLGDSWEVWLELPNGDIEPLVRVPEWDFNWQGSYYFDRYKIAPAGTIIHAEATYDNTIDNPNNPNNPPKFASWGEGTEDEMYYLPIGFVPYQEGDEDIVFEGTPVNVVDLEESKNAIYPIIPNPVRDLAVAGFFVEHGQVLNISIFDMQGRKIRNLRQGEFYNIGEHHVNFSTLQLSSGIYVFQIEGNGIQMTQKFIKQ